MSRRALRYTLLGDGSSDAALLPVLAWLLREHLPTAPIGQGQFADLGRLPGQVCPDRADLPARMRVAAEYYTCDVLFTHRDAEQSGQYAARRDRIDGAAQEAGLGIPVIPVVPVRMTETWLLHDEAALRRAAGRPNDNTALGLPSMKYTERVHAKDRLFAALQTAAALSGRRAKQFSASEARARLALLIDDFSPLRQFEAFQDLERDIKEFCAEWNASPDA